MGERPHLLVFGGASLDVLHFGGRTERSAGGAGLYTALAAHAAGARVTMIAPRPEPMPEELAPADRRLDWRGPRVRPEELPSVEIAHLGGGATEMRGVELGAEEELSVEDLPATPTTAERSTFLHRNLAAVRLLAGAGWSLPAADVRSA